jgi:hypothetical protein
MPGLARPLPILLGGHDVEEVTLVEQLKQEKGSWLILAVTPLVFAVS